MLSMSQQTDFESNHTETNHDNQNELTVTTDQLSALYADAKKIFNAKQYSESLDTFLFIAKEIVKIADEVKTNFDTQLLSNCFWQIGIIHRKQKHFSGLSKKLVFFIKRLYGRY